MLTILRLIVFALSSVGFWEFLRRRTKVHVCFLPSMTVALQTCLMLLGGLLNLLWAFVWILCLLGIIFLVSYIVKDRGLRFLRSYLHISYLFLLILSVLLLVLLYGRFFSHYDNFSHWALVVKQMFLTDRLPNFQDTIIQFQDYPLGSSVFIYYLAKVVSGSESVQMFAQAYVMVTCMMPLFYFVQRRGVAGTGAEVAGAEVSVAEMRDQESYGVRKNSGMKYGATVLAALVLGLCAANFFLIYNIAITNLLVDSLLALAAGCSFLYAWEYGWRQPEVHRRTGALNEAGELSGVKCASGCCGSAVIRLVMIAVYLIWLVQIKNAGFFFAAFIMIGVLIGIRKDRRVLTRILVVLAPIISAIIWKRHCSYVFPDAAVSKHAMSVENYASVLGGKSSEAISQTVSGVARFSVTYIDVLAVFGMVLLMVIAICIFVKRERKHALLLGLFSLALYITYQLGLMAMYIFSMPETEASYLAEIERYTKSVLMVIVYLWVLMVIRLVSGGHLLVRDSAVESESVKPWASWLAVILSGAALFGILIVSFGEIRLVGQYTENLEERQWLEAQAEAYDIPYGSSYFIFPKQEDGAYSYYLGMYLFNSPYVDEVFVDEPKDLEEVWGDYVFVFDEGNPIIEEWVEENYPEQVGEAVIECRTE